MHVSFEKRHCAVETVVHGRTGLLQELGLVSLQPFENALCSVRAIRNMTQIICHPSLSHPVLVRVRRQ
jgi:hypothetical protein